MTRLEGVEGLVARVATTPDGYALAIYLAAKTAVSEWYAEVILPQSAELVAGPGTRLDGKRLYPATPALRGSANRPARGTVWAQAKGTEKAPVFVRVHATTPGGSGDAPMAKPVVSDPRTKSTAPATEDNWPGSTRMGGSSGGSGGGGGGGGGGQCELYIDWNNGIVRHKTDAGGGGGAGGGGSHGYYYDTEGHTT